METSRRKICRNRVPAFAWVIAACVSLTLFLVGVPAPECAETTIRIGGTGGALGTMRQLGEAFRKDEPGCRVSILPSLGSGGGIKAVLAGTLDVAVSARPITPEEERQGAKETPYGRSPLVFVTSGHSPASGVTTRQLVEIYSGKMMNWPDGSQIRLVLRPEGDADTLQLMSFSPEMMRAVKAAMSRKGMAFALSDQEAVDVMEKAPGSLGTSVLPMILTEKRSLRVLSLDGVAPTLQSLAAGKYPLARTFYAVTGGNPSRCALRFVALLKSPEGRRILVRTGHLASE